MFWLAHLGSYSATDNPDYIRMFKSRRKKELAEAEKRAEREIEVIPVICPYLKYDVKEAYQRKAV